MRQWPSLDEAKGKVEGMTAQVEQLPVEGKKVLAGMVSAALPPLKELVAKVGDDPRRRVRSSPRSTPC